MSKECLIQNTELKMYMWTRFPSIRGEKSGVQRTLSSYWIYSNILLSFSLNLHIPFSPLYQRISGILMSFNVGYGINGNSFITLFNVMHPSKIRLFFINSPRSAVVALINTSLGLVRTDSIMIFTLRGGNWGKSSDSPKTSQWKNQNWKPTLDSQFSALLKSLLFVHFCVRYMVQKHISAVNQHLLLNLHIWQNI